MRAAYDLPAPAKLNLFLHVIGRRADGYHLLQSIFMLIDWCDEIGIEIRTDGDIRRHDQGADALLPQEDLCVRAARLLKTRSATTLGADIFLRKQVPWGAGMGGGSSDAATTLIALNRLWKLDWSRQRLQQLALELGADVPFFLGGCNAWVEGIGEQLFALDWPADAGPPPWAARWAVIKPGCAIPTSQIFASPLLGRDTKPAILLDFLAAARNDGRAGLSFGGNDLQRAAQATPSGAEVTEALNLLEQRYGHARMTGSGSAVFAFAGFPSPSDSSRADPSARYQMLDLPTGWQGRICAGLDSHPLFDWLPA